MAKLPAVKGARVPEEIAGEYRKVQQFYLNKYSPAGKYEPALCDFVVQEMSAGLSQRAVAAKIGVGVSTLHGWAKAHPEFGHALTHANDCRLLYWETALLGAARRGGGKDAVRACEFALRHADSSWNFAQKLDHSGEIEGGSKQQFVVMISPEDAAL